MGEVIELEHVSWNVGDLERSRDFYQKVLGLKKLDYLQGGGAWIDELCGTKDTFHQLYRMFAPKGPGLTAKGPKSPLTFSSGKTRRPGSFAPRSAIFHWSTSLWASKTWTQPIRD